MALMKNVETRIWNIERFEVIIRDSNGRDLRDDKMGVTMYPFQNAAKNSWTVNTWKVQRFDPNYQGLDVDVLNGDSSPAAGHTLLATVRDSYLED